MSRAVLRLVIAGLVGLSLLALETVAAHAGDPAWGRFQTSARSSNSSQFNTVYYYNNAAPVTAAPRPPSLPVPTAADSNSVTYRSYASDPGSNSGSYYYSPGPCACYCYVPGPSPAVARSPSSSATPPAATTANANSGTYRSFAPDTGTSANNSSNAGANSGAYAGTYAYPSSHSGHSWSGRR